jgi:hypothetical protein
MMTILFMSNYIPLTRPYLEDHQRSGITIYLKGPNDTMTATQESSSVSGFLANLIQSKGDSKQRASIQFAKLFSTTVKYPQCLG